MAEEPWEGPASTPQQLSNPPSGTLTNPLGSHTSNLLGLASAAVRKAASSTPSRSNGFEGQSDSNSAQRSLTSKSESRLSKGAEFDHGRSFMRRDMALTLVEQSDHLGKRYVMHSSNPARLLWTVVLVVCLLYTATVFTYRAAFCNFHFGPDGLDPIGDDETFWKTVDTVIDTVFWIDLFITFFFSIKDEKGLEVDSLKLIACAYLRGPFWLNLLACLPESAVEPLFHAASGNDDASIDFSVARIYRLERMSKLMQLMRMARILRIAILFDGNHPLWRWCEHLRGVRIINFSCALFWCMHLLACGWYVCAALQDDPRATWVAAWSVGDTSLLEADPAHQWLVSMYFVLTVFTTVGFGDISPGTNPEIVYVAFVMMVGAIVHSIVISHVINIITGTDEIHEAVEKSTRLVEAYAKHSQIAPQTAVVLRREVAWHAKTWAQSHSYDKEDMKELFTGGYIPRWLIDKLPETLYEGKLVRNSFLKSFQGPARLPTLLAIHLHPGEFQAHEQLYQVHDFAFCLFVVLSGTFSYIARPSPEGGVPEDYTQEAREWHEGITGSYTFSESDDNRLFPFQLFSHGNFLGDTEIYFKRARHSAARCERSGTALRLHQENIQEIQTLFPQFASMSRAMALRRDAWRARRLCQQKIGRTYRHLAACDIQAFVRRRKNPRRHSKKEEDTRMARAIQKKLYTINVGRIMQKSGKSDALAEEVHALRVDFEAFAREVRAALVEKRQSPAGSPETPEGTSTRL